MNIDTSSKSYSKKSSGKSSKGAFKKMEAKANAVKTKTSGSILKSAKGMTKKQASNLPLANYSATKGATGPGLLSKTMSKGTKTKDEGASNLHTTAGVKNTKKTTTKKASNTTPKAKTSNYTVKRGDTLSEIAQRNKTSVAAIMKSNPAIKDGNKISVGQKLKFAKGKTPVKPNVYAGYDLKTRKPKK